MATLEVRELSSVSPTLAEIMRVCHLRAALSRASGASAYVLGTPKAWLGTAYHAVLEQIARLHSPIQDVEATVTQLWNQAILIQEQRAATHPLDRRFGKAESWPAYYLARASVSLRAREIALSSPFTASPASPNLQHSHSTILLEEKFSVFDGKLVGRPDVVRGDEIRDYKSGSITEFDDETQTEVVRAAYVRQLRIYGFLVGKKLGRYPRRGVLVPLGGAAIEIRLEQPDCEREAKEAVALLDLHNSLIGSCSNIGELASPSPQACLWCPYKIICSKFWEQASPTWSGQLEAEAVIGSVVAEPAIVHQGLAMALTVNVTGGTKNGGSLQIAPLNSQVHQSIASIHVGDAIRIVGLSNRMDGSVSPTQRTVVAPVQTLPSVMAVS